MNRVSHTVRGWGWVPVLWALVAPTAAETLFDQRQLLHSTNATPKGGINWAPQPPRELPSQVHDATTNQFRGAIVYSSVTVQGERAALPAGANFAGAASDIDWPRAQRDGTNALVLRAAVGIPYLGYGFDYLFGQTIVPPLVDAGGNALESGQGAYWHPEPIVIRATTNQVTGDIHYSVDPNHSGAEYYWSPHAAKVYATKAGPIQIIWRAAVSTARSLTAEDIDGTTHVFVPPFYYPIRKETVIVSGVPVKSPQKMYWTKGDYEKTGVPVLVPAGVKGIQFVYNPSIPEKVEESEVVVGGSIRRKAEGAQFDDGNTQIHTRTIAAENGFITAYNREGRIFMELLGDATSETTKRQLGTEIIDVIRDAVPGDVTIELGERVTAYPNNTPSDADLRPAPIQQLAETFAYQRSVNGSGDVELYANRVTRNSTDFQVHWTTNGVGGLRWPYRFVRYALVWPTHMTNYSHYVRPEVANETEAQATAVPLPGENAPKLDYQDPSNTASPRAKITEDARFYTFLDKSQPAHRSLIRYNVGDRVAFERVFSWLDTALKTNQVLASSVATNLTEWSLLGFPTNIFGPAPRVMRDDVIYVGDRVRAPTNELGATGDYLAGYIHQPSGISFDPESYKDPFIHGFDVANRSAILPVNAIPGQDRLEVWWFRRHAPTALRDANLGFLPTYWPAVVCNYKIEYPGPSHPRYRQIVLASNQGSGPLTSLEANGALYRANTATNVVGFNPNEEHALLQGGRVWALRDDLNITTQPNFSSQPYVLLRYADADGRPSMSAFHVVRESGKVRFSYTVEAGTVLQPPMPLPLLDKPMPPTGPTGVPRSVNSESGYRDVTGLTYLVEDNPNQPAVTVAISLSRSSAFPLFEPLRLHGKKEAQPLWFTPGSSDARLKTLTGTLSTNRPTVVTAVGPASSRAYRFRVRTAAIKDATVATRCVLANRDAGSSWPVTIVNPPPLGTDVEFFDVDLAFGAGINPSGNDDILAADLLIVGASSEGQLPAPGVSGFTSGWRVAFEEVPEKTVKGELARRQRFEDQITFQDRKGSLWVYRGPHSEEDAAKRQFQFYYKTMPEFWFPVDGNGKVLGLVGNRELKKQPAEGTITPYLRARVTSFSKDDLVDLPSLAVQLKQPTRPFDIWLTNQFSSSSRSGLASYTAPDPVPDALRDSLLGDLDSLLSGSLMYDKDRFQGIILGPETLNLLSRNPGGGELEYLNRLLLQDAFPLNLAPSDIAFAGDAVYGDFERRTDAEENLVGDGNALGITYRAVWPATAPVLQMAETLTVRKRGLPAIRGQTSLEVLYQQSVYHSANRPSVVLHDPTAAKKFKLVDTQPDGSASGLNKIPSSIQTSLLRGKTYFPRLAPHLVDRFYFDPNDSKNGSLILVGEFKAEALGESYVQPNYLSSKDIQALKDLCAPDDDLKGEWDVAIDDGKGGGLILELETHYPNPAKPGTFTPFVTVNGTPVRQMVEVTAPGLSEVKHSDTAVDSYALTAIGPGTGYVTLVAGQGMAFTPPDEPVSVKVLKVVDTLYRGEVKVVLSSNPLAEKVTLQQIVDLAGKVDDYDFEWWIAAPVDGKAPPVYGNTPTNLLSGTAAGTWQHVAFPATSDTGASLGAPGAGVSPEDRVQAVNDSVVVAISGIPFDAVELVDGRLRFTVDGATTRRIPVGSLVTLRDRRGTDIAGMVDRIPPAGTSGQFYLDVSGEAGVELPAADNVFLLFERTPSARPASVVYQDFSIPSGATFSQFYLSLALDDALGAQVYLDGEPVIAVNLGEDDTPTSSAPSGFSPEPLSKVYALGPQVFVGGRVVGSSVQHRIAVELFSAAAPNAALPLKVQVDAYASVDLVATGKSQWRKLDAERYPDKVRTILGEAADVLALSDNYVISRYQPNKSDHPSQAKGWSAWTDPALAEGWIKRVLAGINPFNQRATDLFNNAVNTDANILTSAGKRWEGDIALNLDSINDYGLIEIYETVLRRGKGLSIDADISYDPANDALLLAAGYLSDLYMLIGNEAHSDASNPTIGIGTKDRTYGDVATALFSFKGQLPTLLEEELALLRGRDDFLAPGVRVAPVYNRLIWNYTRGIDAGEVVYALNYNILDQNADGRIDAADAAKLYPQGHGDAYGHYLSALKGYYALLIDKDFAWVPRIEAVNVLGKPVAVDYQDERKFATAAAAVARAGRQIVELTWRRDYRAGDDVGWSHLKATRSNTTQPIPTQREWGVDHWARRTGQGAYLNWIMGNSILPPVDPDPTHEGIQKVDRTTVPELKELATTGSGLQTVLDNVEGRLTPLGLAGGSLAFDINPNQIAGNDPKPHFEQVYDRALVALDNAVASFDDAKDVTRLMRSEQDSLAELQASIAQQELAYTSALIELYGTPYPDDIGPGKLYKQGYEGPDLFHYTYVETESIEAPGVFTPNQPDYVAKIDIQQLNANWSYLSNPPRTDLSTSGPVDGTSSDLVIVNINDPKYEAIDPLTGKKLYYIPYAFGSHGFFDKPAEWTSKRRSPGKIQQAISEIIQAHDRMYYALAAQCESDKQDLDKAVQVFKQQLKTFNQIQALEEAIKGTQNDIDVRTTGYEIANKWVETVVAGGDMLKEALLAAVPDELIFGTSNGGDTITPGAHSLILAGTSIRQAALLIGDASAFTAGTAKNLADMEQLLTYGNQIADLERQQALREAIFDLGNRLKAVQGDFQVINEKLRILDDAKRRYASLVAEGDRLQEERQVFRQRSAAIVQGFRTRDAAFRIFRNEKLERYKSLFDLSARYAYLAANAYDYDTGLLNTPKGQEFVARIVNSRALGLVREGTPQFAGSNLGDPGLSSVLAEMKSDWDVLKGRLGFNNPTAYGTTFSLRTEKHRILPGVDGGSAWKDVLLRSKRANLLEDADVKRYCMRIDSGNGLPVPGLVVEFETTIADGYNFFGERLLAWDRSFDTSAFATKIFGVGVAFEGYVGMENPVANSGAVAASGGVSPADPNLSFLDPNGLAGTPGIYLIPVGLDSMRSPALGDADGVRTWNVEDVTIPLPFNVGGSEFSSKALYQTSDSLSERLFDIRKHASFRPVSTAQAFGNAVYGSSGMLQRSQYTNTRLIGRSVWNSKWKLVIPGTKLLNDPEEGVRRFVNSVSDIKLHLVTYSYAGN